MIQSLQAMTTALADLSALKPGTGVAGAAQRGRPSQASVVPKCIVFSILAATLAFLAAFVLQHPLATNDGPVHVAFSHLILTYHQPAQPLQSSAYTLGLKPSPNLGVYFLMAAMMRFLSPTMTESLVQLLCIFGPIVAGYFAIYTINPRNVWLAAFLLPLVLSQMFFLGLYNHCFSLAAFFLVVGTYFWMTKAPSYVRAVALFSSLLLTFFCHASGFVMAFSGLAAMSSTLAIIAFSRNHNLLEALRPQRYTVFAMLATLPLGALFLASGGKSETKYGVRFTQRIYQFAKLHLLATNYPLRDRYPAMLLSGVLVTAFAVVVIRIVAKRSELTQDRRDLAIGAVVATASAIVIMLAFPDVMGGGWTHFRRFEVFPYFWIILVLAFETYSKKAVLRFTIAGTFVTLLLVISTTIKQRKIREQMVPLSNVDSLIGSHCTVLPIVLQAFLLDRESNIDWMTYQPFYQSASRLELHDDRVVLFNYLARLPPYPVHFRANVEPQEHLFHWKPQQLQNDVEQIDIKGFEAGSGMRVDYLLLWGNLGKRSAEMQTQVQNAVSQFEVIYQSLNGNVKLYRRRGVHNSACTMAPQSSQIAVTAQ